MRTNFKRDVFLLLAFVNVALAGIGVIAGQPQHQVESLYWTALVMVIAAEAVAVKEE